MSPTRAIAIAFAGCVLGVLGCDDAPPPAPAGPTETLVLDATEDGTLLFCEADRCQRLPNPEGCARLELTIDPETGSACALCFDAAGQRISERCDGASLSCTVVTAPEPDCVVCAYQGGTVVYSSCRSEQPLECVSYSSSTGPDMSQFGCERDGDCPAGAFCREGRCQADPALGECRVCFGPNGNVILDECGAECRVGCPSVECGPGFEQVVYPGSCCPRCVPALNCSAEVCPVPGPIPECPSGTVLRRDPQDCCSYLCVPNDCSLVECSTEATAQRCPAGSRLSFEFPNCCGACVPNLVDPALCADATDCGPDELCTTSLGDCFTSCADPAEDCPAGCFGLCRPLELNCPDYPSPDPDGCDGEWRRAGRDEVGCPLPPVCVCPDGTRSFDGTCEDSCSNIECSAQPACGEGERLEFGFPYCCGICVPEEQCRFEPRRCEVSADCDAPELQCIDGFCLSEATASCPIPSCSPNEAIGTGEGCCPVCVPAERYCVERSECATGERCTTELGDCRLDPSCGSADGGCDSRCFGVCEPLP